MKKKNQKSYIQLILLSILGFIFIILRLVIIISLIIIPIILIIDTNYYILQVVRGCFNLGSKFSKHPNNCNLSVRK